MLRLPILVATTLLTGVFAEESGPAKPDGDQTATNAKQQNAQIADAQAGQPPAAGTQPWEVSAGLLMFQPSFGNTTYAYHAQSGGGAASGSAENNDFTYSPGFRLTGAYQLSDNRSIQASFSYLNVSETSTASGDFLWAANGHPDIAANFENYSGSAKADTSVAFYNIAIDYARAWQVDAMSVVVMGGLQYVSFHVEEQHTYTKATAEGVMKGDSAMWGWGPKLGLALSYPLFGDRSGSGLFMLNAAGSFSILSGYINHSRKETYNSNTIVDVNDDETSRVVPVFNMNLGVSYAIMLGGFPTYCALAYEFQSYQGAINRFNFTDDVGDGRAINEAVNFDLQGFTLTAGMAF